MHRAAVNSLFCLCTGCSAEGNAAVLHLCCHMRLNTTAQGEVSAKPLFISTPATGLSHCREISNLNLLSKERKCITSEQEMLFFPPSFVSVHQKEMDLVPHITGSQTAFSACLHEVRFLLIPLHSFQGGANGWIKLDIASGGLQAQCAFTYFSSSI